MPQVLKAHIKKDILKSGLSEFYKTGYENTKIRDIAINANVSPGNIYRYFENKEDLFKAIINPVAEKLTTYSAELKEKINNFASDKTNQELSSDHLIEKLSSIIVELVKENKKEVSIILNNDTMILNQTVNMNIEELFGNLFKAVNSLSGKTEESLLINALSKSLKNGIATIIEESKSIEEAKVLLEKYLKYYF
jgi:AcrR family transcriptional regulator